MRQLKKSHQHFTRTAGVTGFAMKTGTRVPAVSSTPRADLKCADPAVAEGAN